MRHIGQELAITSIRCLPRRGVLLDAIAQIEDHLHLERIHLSARFNYDAPGKVAVYSCFRDLCKPSHRESMDQMIRQHAGGGGGLNDIHDLLSDTLHGPHLRLNPKLVLRPTSRVTIFTWKRQRTGRKYR